MGFALFCLGIWAIFPIVCSGSGVIDISNPDHLALFSPPLKLGELFLYKLNCVEGHTELFAGNVQLFPVKSDTKMVNLLLGYKNYKFELVNVGYCDSSEPFMLKNLYYFHEDEAWKPVDHKTYKSQLFKQENNYVTFDLKLKENAGFKRVKNAKDHGFDSYQLEEGFGLEKVYDGLIRVWENEPNFKLHSLDASEKFDHVDNMRLRYSNYFSTFFEYHKFSSGLWSMDRCTRIVDLLSLKTHGCKPSSFPYPLDDESRVDKRFNYEAENHDFGEETLVFTGSDLLGTENKALRWFRFGVKFDGGEMQKMKLGYRQYFTLYAYEFGKFDGCILEFVDFKSDNLFTFDGENYLHSLKISHIDHNPTLLVTVKTVTKPDCCDANYRACRRNYGKLNQVFQAFNNSVWNSLEKFEYFVILSKLLEEGGSHRVREMYKNPPKTKQRKPKTPNLNYGGLKPFTYDLNNPFDQHFDRTMIYTDPDLIMMKVNKEFALNVVVDGENVLWEQKRSGKGCLVIYIYRSDDAVMSHFVLDSESEPHLFFKFDNTRWLPIDQNEYEKSKERKSKFAVWKKDKEDFDEYNTSRLNEL